MEKSSITREFPIAKAAYSFLKDDVSASFSFPAWNKGRIVCQRPQLKKILSGSSDGSKRDEVITLSNSSFIRTRTPTNVVSGDQYNGADSETNGRRTRPELITNTV